MKQTRFRVPATWFAFAFAIRSAYWMIAPARAASDSAEFVRAAQALLAGQWSELREFPFHAAYAFLLAPGLIGDDHLREYLPVLHITLSAGSVVLVWAIAHQLTDDGLAAHAAALIASVYPTMLFWMPYLLTDTAFVFFLLAFAWALADCFAVPTRRRWAMVGLLGAFLFFLRPVALALVIASALVVPVVRARPEHRRSLAATLIACVAIGAALAWSAPARTALLRVPTIAQTLWLSTTVVHGTQAEIAAAAGPAAIRQLPASGQYAWKGRTALAFIAAHPGVYLLMAAHRFVSFWAPWLYLDWSPRHRALDAAVTLPLLLLGSAAARLSARRAPWLLSAGFALLLAAESAFGQIDADARYRLPAEVLLIAPAAVAAMALMRRSTGRVDHFRVEEMLG